MKQPSYLRSFMKLGLSLLFMHTAFAQGYDDPLSIQGLDRTNLPSAASRGAGGLTIGIQNDAALLLSNPASLQTLKGIQVSLGGVQQYSNANQVQQFGPLKYYSNFSLLMEGLTGYIPNPDSNHIGGTPGDSVQRPFDGIGPNWSRSKNRTQPIQVLIGVPFSVGDMKFAAGAGVVNYADLTQYYQNNNVLTPSILSVRPSPFPLPSNVLTQDARWFQYSRMRDGQIRGYGAAVSGAITDEISAGISGMILKGSTDDFEQHTGRGRLTFYANYFRLDSVYSHIVRVGTSDYKGQEFTFSAAYRGKYVTVGIVANPPMTITRDYNANILVDTTGVPITTVDIGQDKVKLPWRGTVGLSIAVKENLNLGFEYEVRSYASAVHSNAGDPTYGHILQSAHLDSVVPANNPWLSSSVFHVGAEYTPVEWLVVRAGVRGQVEAFEPEGNPISGEPVSYSIYSLGCGVLFGPARLNVTYEYGRMKYQDVWGGAISLNQETRQAIVADLAYELPWRLF